ncbi:MAG: DUF5989 family protein [Myxococcota bacterium]|nr:DUF5989 family protein [Myxococcota bacterium]MEC9390266.1 DUF5989 family protein [Myxococcota bacterium]
MPDENNPSNLSLRMGTIGQVYKMLKRSKRWWMLPMVTILVLLGLALSGLQAVQYVAPFIYAVF